MSIKKEENGEIMVEAIYVVVIAIMVIFFTMNVGVVFHNRNVLSSIANEAANGIAEIYGSIGKEPFYGYTDPEYFSGRSTYRHWNKSLLKERAQEKGKWYASFLIDEKEFSAEEMDFSGVKVICDQNSAGQDIIRVTIEKEYPVFTGAPGGIFGHELNYTIKVEGVAICYDIIHEMQGMALGKEINAKLDSLTKTSEAIKTIIELVDKIKGTSSS